LAESIRQIDSYSVRANGDVVSTILGHDERTFTTDSNKIAWWLEARAWRNNVNTIAAHNIKTTIYKTGAKPFMLTKAGVVEARKFFHLHTAQFRQDHVEKAALFFALPQKLSDVPPPHGMHFIWASSGLSAATLNRRFGYRISLFLNCVYTPTASTQFQSARH
jgi:hypothetical protein